MSFTCVKTHLFSLTIRRALGTTGLTSNFFISFLLIIFFYITALAEWQKESGNKNDRYDFLVTCMHQCRSLDVRLKHGHGDADLYGRVGGVPDIRCVLDLFSPTCHRAVMLYANVQGLKNATGSCLYQKARNHLTYWCRGVQKMKIRHLALTDFYWLNL